MLTSKEGIDWHKRGPMESNLPDEVSQQLETLNEKTKTRTFAKRVLDAFEEGTQDRRLFVQRQKEFEVGLAARIGAKPASALLNILPLFLGSPTIELVQQHATKATLDLVEELLDRYADFIVPAAMFKVNPHGFYRTFIEPITPKAFELTFYKNDGSLANFAITYSQMIAFMGNTFRHFAGVLATVSQEDKATLSNIRDFIDQIYEKPEEM